MAKSCNFFQNKLHQQVLLDAKRKVKRFQLSNPHSFVMPCNQKTSGHFVPGPGPDRVKKAIGQTHIWDRQKDTHMGQTYRQTLIWDRQTYTHMGQTDIHMGQTDTLSTGFLYRFSIIPLWNTVTYPQFPLIMNTSMKNTNWFQKSLKNRH